MNELKGAGLLDDWGAVNSQPDSSSPSEATGVRCGALRQPWQVRETEAASNEGLDPDAPDFGIRFARRFATACRLGVIPRRRKRGLLRQQGDGLKWIRHAIRYLERRGKGRAGGEVTLSPPQRVVKLAIALDRDAVRRGLLRRLLVAHGAEVAQVAQVLGLTAAEVEAYQALFFDVRNRAGNPFRFVASLGDASAGFGGAAAGGTLPPLWEFASVSFPVALLRCGLDGRGEAAGFPAGAVDAAQVSRFESATRFVMMPPDPIDVGSGTVVEALARYKKMETELRADLLRVSLHESFIKPVEALRALHRPEAMPGGEDDGVGAADGADGSGLEEGGVQGAGLLESPLMAGARDGRRVDRQYKEALEIMREIKAADEAALPDAVEYVPLTAADLRRVCDLWRECQRVQTAQGRALAPRKPPVLESVWKKCLRAAVPADPWERPGAGELPPEMEVPDFGWRLARTAAACGLQAKLPADEAFYWIRLAAGMDVQPGAGSAREACWRVPRLAEDLHQRPAARHLLQAALLTREAGIAEVASCLALDPQVVAAYATLFFNGLGRAGGELRQLRLKQGAAEPLRKAPEITLEQLQWLLGFKSPCENPADAARMLLRYVSISDSGQGEYLAWDDEEPRNPRRAAKGRRTAKAFKAFEAVVADAGKLMNASRFGVAAAFMGAGATLEKSLGKAQKAWGYQRVLHTYIDSGMTEEEAGRKLQAAKEERRAQNRRQMERQARENHG